MSEPINKKLEKPVEVLEKATRRRFTAAYKAQILDEADTCEPGELGELLRREGLYSSSLSRWRAERDAEALDSRKRGRKAKSTKKEILEMAQLKRENERLAERLRQAELIIEVQKKVSEMMETKPLERED
jgi:transposase-like protein